MIINLKTAKMLSIALRRRPLLGRAGSNNRRTTITPMSAFDIAALKSISGMLDGALDCSPVHIGHVLALRPQSNREPRAFPAALQ
jgi:hypothetical protein